MFKVHCIIRNKPVISTKELVYSNSPAGKLEEQAMVSGLNVPLQQGFYSNSERSLPVTIDNLPAFAFEEGIVGIVMSVCQSTAVAAPFARVPTINNFKNNIFIKASACQNFSEFCKRNPHYFLVDFMGFSLFAFYNWKFFEVFNCNVSIKTQSHICNVLDNFSEPVLDKVSFFGFEPDKFPSCLETSFVSKRLQQGSVCHYLFSLNPNVFSKISLLQDFSFGRKNGNSKAFGVGVDSQNVFSLWQFGFFFGKISDNLSATSQPECLATPTSCKQRNESLVVPVLFDWNSDWFSGVSSEFNKEISFGVKSLAVSWNIELDGDSLDNRCFASNDISFNVTDNLGIERGVFLAC